MLGSETFGRPGGKVGRPCHSALTAARRVYERAGFKLTHQWTHDMFCKQLSAETWDLELHQQ